jgi:aminopeptidase N
MSAMRLLARLALLFAATQAQAAVPRLDLHVDLDPAARTLRARAGWKSEGETLFPLHRSLELRAVTVDGKPQRIEPPVEQGETRVWRIATREGSRLRIEYGGTLPALDRALDDRAVLRERRPMASPEGSFFSAGSGWYPRPAALFTWRVDIALPAGQRALVGGTLVAESVPRGAQGRSRASFAADVPVEGIDLVAGPYAVRERMVARAGRAPLRLRTYFYRDMDALAEDYLRDCQRYIDLYSAAIGAYPYGEYSVVASPLPTGYGMPRFTYIGAEVLKLPFIRASSLRHEVLHNWWGNGVYVDDASGNWSEGLTTFMSDYAAKEEESPRAAAEMRLAWLRDFAAIPAGAARTLADFRARTHGAEAAVGYGKSAMVFVMLRDSIGAEAFARGLRRFWEMNRFKSATWGDLRTALEETSGRSLDAFFAQWLGRAGAPALRIVAARRLPFASGERLVLSIEQSAPAYELHAPVELVSGAQSEIRWFDIRREQEGLALEVARMPEQVRLDPQFRIWRMLEASELPPILRRWIIARAPRLAIVTRDAGVPEAARALAAQFFEARATEVAADAPGEEPLLIIGLGADADAALAKLGLPARPANLSGRGTAQVWTVHSAALRAPVAVIAARDAAALSSLARPLRHYGAQSYLAFDGAKMIERGVWPAAGVLVTVRR